MVWAHERECVSDLRLPWQKSTDWLAQQKFMSLQFWRLNIKDQSVSGVGFCWGLSSWLGGGGLFAMSSLSLSSVQTPPWYLCVLFAHSYKDSSQIRLGLPTTASKQRHHFANKGLSSQSYCFSSSHVWMWDLDCKEDWEPKNWCFWIVVLENTPDSPWTARRSNQSILKEINPEYSLEVLMLKLKL